MNFPNTHYLSRPPTAIAQADVILGLELTDFWATVNAYIDNGDARHRHRQQPRIKPDTKLISISSVELHHQVELPGLPALPGGRRADGGRRRGDAAGADRGGEGRRSRTTARPRSRSAARPPRRRTPKGATRTQQAAAIAWDASPISTARLGMEIYRADQGPRLVDGRSVRQRQQLAERGCGRWRSTTTGSARPAATASATARRPRSAPRSPTATSARFSVSIQSDGDLMYAPGVLWTAARHKIPLLTVMHNNRGYHQEVMHVQRLSNFRNRVANLGNDMGPVGTSIENPDIEYHKLAESMGWWAKGPIKDPEQLGPALKEAVDGGEVRPARAAQRLDAAALRRANIDAFRVHVGAGGARRRPRARQRRGARRGSAEKGKTAFVKHGCWQCHGFQGQGGVTGPQARAGPAAARDVHGVRATIEPRDAAVHARSDPVERRPRRHPRLSGVAARSRPTTRAFRCSTSRAARSEIDRPGLAPGRCFSAPGRAQVQQRIQRSSTSRSLLQPAQQIMTLAFDACSSSVRMASRCSGVPEITRCSQAPQIPSSQE